MPTPEKVVIFALNVSDICQELASKPSPELKDVEYAAAQGRLLLTQLGSFASIWEHAFSAKNREFGIISTGGLDPMVKIFRDRAQIMAGASRSIWEAISNGHLTTIDELVSAELLDDLFEHAEELSRKKYYLASVVIMRAVLEERLRKLCIRDDCLPPGRPTIEGLNTALYSHHSKQPVPGYGKADQKNVTALADPMNDAAHAKREIKKEDAEYCTMNLRSFLAKFAIA